MADVKRRWELIVLNVIAALMLICAAALAFTGHQTTWSLGKITLYSPVFGFGILAAITLATSLIVKKCWPVQTYPARWGRALIIWFALAGVVFLFIVRYPVSPGIKYSWSKISYEERGVKIRFSYSSRNGPLTPEQEQRHIGFFGTLRHYSPYFVKSGQDCSAGNKAEHCQWVECEDYFELKLAGMSFIYYPYMESPLEPERARHCRAMSSAEVRSREQNFIRYEKWP